MSANWNDTKKLAMNMQVLATEVVKHMSADKGTFEVSVLSSEVVGMIKDRDNPDGQWFLCMRHDEAKGKIVIWGNQPQDKKGDRYGEMPMIKVSDKGSPQRIAALIEMDILLEYREMFDQAATDRDTWDKRREDIEFAQAAYIALVPGSSVIESSDSLMRMPGFRRFQVSADGVQFDTTGSVPHAAVVEILEVLKRHKAL